MLKKILFILAATILKPHTIQTQEPYFENANYCIYANLFNTSSGFKPGISLNAAFNENRSLLGLGVFFDTETGKFGGFNVLHEIRLGKKINRKTPFVAPYLFYNLIYRITYINKLQVVNPNFQPPLDNTQVRYASIEHYVGPGITIKLSRSIFIQTSLGFGCYLGSIKKAIEVESMALKKGGNGFSILEKTVVGYNF
jgi:hypothetical protein